MGFPGASWYVRRQSREPAETRTKPGYWQEWEAGSRTRFVGEGAGEEEDVGRRETLLTGKLDFVGTWVWNEMSLRG